MKNADRQAAYLARFEELVTQAEPRHAGRIEWASGVHFFFQNTPVAQAAALYVNNRKGELS